MNDDQNRRGIGGPQTEEKIRVRNGSSVRKRRANSEVYLNTEEEEITGRLSIEANTSDILQQISLISQKADNTINGLRSRYFHKNFQIK